MENHAVYSGIMLTNVEPFEGSINDKSDVHILYNVLIM